jgi:hypothetical protein
LIIGHSLVEEIFVRMDSLLPTDFQKFKPDKRRKYYEVIVDVEFRVKNAVTFEVKHKERVIANYTTTSL